MQAGACHNTVPSGSTLLLRKEAVSAVAAVVIMELMRAHLLSRMQQKPVAAGSQRHISKADKMSGIPSGRRQNACHRDPIQHIAEIEKAAAFRKARKSGAYRSLHGSPHRFIFGQRLFIQLGIAAAEIQAMTVRRKGFVIHRAEKDKLAAEPLQKTEII